MERFQLVKLCSTRSWHIQFLRRHDDRPGACLRLSTGCPHQSHKKPTLVFAGFSPLFVWPLSIKDDSEHFAFLGQLARLAVGSATVWQPDFARGSFELALKGVLRCTDPTEQPRPAHHQLGRRAATSDLSCESGNPGGCQPPVRTHWPSGGLRSSTSRRAAAVLALSGGPSSEAAGIMGDLPPGNAGEGLYAFGPDDGAELAELDSGPVSAASASRTWAAVGRRHLAAAYDRTLRLFSVGGRRRRRRRRGPLLASPTGCAVTALVGGIRSRAGEAAAVASSLAPPLDGEVVLWSAANRSARAARCPAWKRLGDRYLLAGVSNLLVLTSAIRQLTVATAGEDASIPLWHTCARFEARRRQLNRPWPPWLPRRPARRRLWQATRPAAAGPQRAGWRAVRQHDRELRALLDCGSEAGPGVIRSGPNLIYLWSSDQAELQLAVLLQAAAAAVQDCPPSS
uniref:WD_REPEATS_REGION domain-containing protein n=1 Tax=Macrostomum lignano TaxID=282301 RepID=A0A1I8FH87_9PLAT